MYKTTFPMEMTPHGLAPKKEEVIEFVCTPVDMDL